MTTISSIDARYAQVQVGEASKKVAASVQNLVSGTKANAGVADLSVGTVLASRVNTLRVAVGNAGQAKSLLETAKGGLNTILGLLQQQKSLATKASDDSLGNNERGFLNQEFQALVSEIDRIAETANFNGKALLDGSISGVASLESATGLSVENYSLIKGSSYSTAGTVGTGNLVTTNGTRGENKFTFGASGAGGTAVITFYNGDAVGATDATETVSFTSASTAIGSAANFVAAANEATGDIVRSFDFIDNLDGTVTVRAAEVGTHLDNYEFNLTTADSIATFTVGNDGSATTALGARRAFDEDRSSLTPSANGVFTAVNAHNFGQVRGSAALALTIANGTANETVVITLTDNDNNTGTISFVVADNDLATTVTNFNTAVNASTSDVIRKFTFEHVSSTTATAGVATWNVRTADKGDYANEITFSVTSESGAGDVLTAATFGGDTIHGAATESLSSGSGATAGSDRAVAAASATYDENLIGSISNISATFNESANSGSAGGQRNTVTFTAEVNGITYVSDGVTLFGSSGSGASLNGNTIKANQRIYFYNPNGPTESTTDGDFTDNGFSLQVGTSDITLATFTTATGGQLSMNTIAGQFETQVAGIKILQDRTIAFSEVNASSSDHRITSTVGTILDGLRGFDAIGTDSTDYNVGDIRLISDGYNAAGTQGSVGDFTVDRLTDTISVTIDDIEYVAYLNSANAPTTGGVRAFGLDHDSALTNDGSYNSTTKIIDLDDGSASGSNAKFVFYSTSTTDNKRLEIDLGHVKTNTAQIDISTDEGEEALATALNAAFGVASNESLNFQVGNAASDTIGVSIAGTKTTDVYLNDSGSATVLSVDTLENAAIASDVLDNAINNVVTRISNVSAKISSFNSSIQNNQTSIQNADAARSKLLDTDYTEESTMFAESRVRVDAATSVLAQINTRAQNLLRLLSQ